MGKIVDLPRLEKYHEKVSEQIEESIKIKTNTTLENAKLYTDSKIDKIIGEGISTSVEDCIGENLLPFPSKITNSNASGVTYTFLDNGSVNVSGTVEISSLIQAYTNTFELSPGTYTLSNKTDGTGDNRVGVFLSNSPNTYFGDPYSGTCEGLNKALNTYAWLTDTLEKEGNVVDSITFSIEQTAYAFLYFSALDSADTTISAILYPMLEFGETAHTFQPYNLNRQLLRDDIDKIKDIYTTNGVNLGRLEGSTIGLLSFALGYNTIASNQYSHAEGYSTTASGDSSHSEGKSTNASGNYSHAEGYSTTASGENSHAEGKVVYAEGEYSHAEGYNTTASGEGSHSEGYRTYATGDYSHSEGKETHSTGIHSHVEGYLSQATANCAHAEGYNTEAEGMYSHAEGYRTLAGANYSHAEGIGTMAFLNQHALGHYNFASPTEANTDSGTTTGSVFIIGNGTSMTQSNAFRITGEGKVYGKGSYNTSGADYAEYAEWADGNVDNEDRRGYFVTFDETKTKMIRIANEGDYILGIVSGNPCIVGNSDEDWLGKYITDEFGTILYEEVEVEEPYLDEETGEEKTKTITTTFYKLNPEYDPEREYENRESRREWSAIGWVGILSVRDDGTCVPGGYCKCANGGIATSTDRGYDTYKVVERVSDNVIRVAIR